MSQRVKCTVIREGEEKIITNHLPENCKNIDFDNRVRLVKANLKMQYAAIVCPLLKGININSIELVDKIIDALEINPLELNSLDYTNTISTILVTELFRIGMEVSNKTGKDYASYINEQKEALNAIIRNIYIFIK